MKELKEVLGRKAEAGEEEHPDIPFPSPFPESYKQRSRELGLTLYNALGITREDKDKRWTWAIKGKRLFDAPNAIIVYADGSLGPWSILDCGIVIQTIMIAATAFGLGTCAEVSGVVYPQDLRQILNISDGKQIVCAIAIGYADSSAPENNFPRQRESLENLVTWCGL